MKLFKTKKQKDYLRFQENMKPGDPCYFYWNGNLMIGEIDEFLSDNQVIVLSEFGRSLRDKSDLYPFKK